MNALIILSCRDPDVSLAGSIQRIALNPDATVYSPSHQSHGHGHNDGGLDVQAPGGDGGGTADPTKYKEMCGRWCHFVPGLGWTASKQ